MTGEIGNEKRGNDLTSMSVILGEARVVIGFPLFVPQQANVISCKNKQKRKKRKSEKPRVW